jgi:hypothetical protein
MEIRTVIKRINHSIDEYLATRHKFFFFLFLTLSSLTQLTFVWVLVHIVNTR